MALFVGVVGTAAVLGFWDGIMRGTNTFKVVNAANDTLDVRLLFPSGHTEEFTLIYKYHFFVPETGEGYITAVVNGVEVGTRGYVTSVNSPMLIVLSEQSYRIYLDR